MYSNVATGDGLAQACDTCDAGEYEFADCTTSTDRDCRTCDVCTASEWEQTPCDATTNTDCQPCFQCPVGYYETVACTATSDSQCAVCSEGHFCPGDKNEYGCSTCGYGTTVGTPCSAFADTVCLALAETVFACPGGVGEVEPASLVAGFAHQCVLLSTNEVKCWGQNTAGVLGQGITDTNAVIGDAVGALGASLPAVNLGSNELARQICSGYNHVCVLLYSQRVKCWGDNSKGQLGIRNTNDQGASANDMGDALRAVDLGMASGYPTAVSCGVHHTCAIMSDGSARCWGDNTYGQLGIGSAQTAYGTSGGDAFGDLLPAVNVGSGVAVEQITAGQTYTCVLLDDGGVKCFGIDNGYDDLLERDGSSAPGYVGVSAGAPQVSVHSTNLVVGGSPPAGTTVQAVLLDGQIGGTYYAFTNPATCDGTVGNSGWVVMDLGLLTVINTVKVVLFVGNSRYCMLRVEVSQATVFGGEETVVLSCDDYTDCGTSTAQGYTASFSPLLVRYVRFRVGRNNVNAGAHITEASVGIPPDEISGVGYQTICARFAEGSGVCWGSDANGMVGNGAGKTDVVGDAAGEMAALVPFQPGGQAIERFIASPIGRRTCVVLQLSGEVACWGLSYGDAAATALPVASLSVVAPVHSAAFMQNHDSTCVFAEAGTVQCIGTGYFGLAAGLQSYVFGTPSPLLDFGGAGAGGVCQECAGGQYKGIKATAMVASGVHFCILFENQQVKCFGRNQYLGLGYGSTSASNHVGDAVDEIGDSGPGFVNFGTGETVDHMCAGEGHTCVLLNSGIIKCWGRNDLSQSATGTSHRATPVEVLLGPTPIRVRCGMFSTCAVMSDGRATCWGSNMAGRLGRGQAASTLPPSQTWINVGTGRTVVDIAPSNEGTCALLDGNEVKCWGRVAGYGDWVYRGNSHATMGDNLPVVDLGVFGGSPVSLVSPARDTFCVILESSLIKCWGSDTDGAVGNGDFSTGRIGDGPNEMGVNLLTVGGLGGVTKVVSAGYGTTVCAIADATLYCWGSGFSSSPGTAHADIPTGDVVDAAYTPSGMCVLLQSDRSMRCWNYNGVFYYWGLNFEPPSPTPINLGTVSDPGIPACLACTACSSSTLFESTVCRGSTNTVCQSCKTECDYPLIQNITAVCAARADLQCEFACRAGEAYVGRAPPKIVAGGYHTCALLDGGLVKCWGSNTYGQLGVNVNGQTRVGDTGNEVGANLPYLAFGAGRTVGRIAAGFDFSCALMDNRELKCWGRNHEGQLGLGDQVSRAMGTNLEALAAVDFGGGSSVYAVDVYAGDLHTCAIMSTGRARCWGLNDYSMCGVNSPANILSPSTLPGDIDLGVGERVTQMALSATSTCALLQGGQMRCWGRFAPDGQAAAVSVFPPPYVDFGGRVPAQNTSCACCAVYDLDPGKLVGTATIAPIAPGCPACFSAEMISFLPGEGYYNLGTTELGGDFTVALWIYPLGVSAHARFVDIRNPSGTYALRFQWHNLARRVMLVLKNNNVNTNVIQDGASDLIPLNAWTHIAASLEGTTGRVYVNGVCLGENPSMSGFSTILRSQSQLGMSVAGSSNRYHGHIADFVWYTRRLTDDEIMQRFGGAFTSDRDIHLFAGDSCATNGCVQFCTTAEAAPNVRRVARLGENSMCAIFDTRQAKCWGEAGNFLLQIAPSTTVGDDPGEVGDGIAFLDLGPSSSTEVVTISGRFDTGCAVLTDERVICWGVNSKKQLGIGETTMGTFLVAPTLYVDNLDTEGAVEVALGVQHACALISTGRIQCWGDNSLAQLRLGRGSASPATAGSAGDVSIFHTGVLGDIARRFDCLNCTACPPTYVINATCTEFIDTTCHPCPAGLFATVSQDRCFACEPGFDCTSGEPVGCVGGVSFSTDGGGCLPCRIGCDDPLSQVLVTGTCTVTADAQCAPCPEGSSCAASVATPCDDTHYCPGDGMAYNCTTCPRNARLLQACNATHDAVCETCEPGALVGVGTASATQMCSGAQHTCVVVDNGKLKCWGVNTDDRLGWEHPEVVIAGGDGDEHIGDTMSETRDGLPYAALDLPVSHVFCGKAYTCVLFLAGNGTLKCFGANFYGQVGDGHISPVGAPSTLPVVPLPGTVKQVVALDDAVCVLLAESSDVHCWGGNAKGELGLGSTAAYVPEPTSPVDLGARARARAIAGTKSSMCALLFSGAVKCWGARLDGVPGSVGRGPADMGDNLAAVALSTATTGAVPAGLAAIGATAVCVLFSGAGGDSFPAACFGAAWDGADDLSIPPSFAGVLRMHGRCEHTCALTADGFFKCWGRNHYGQLGDGTTVDKVGAESAVSPFGAVGERWAVVAFSTGDGFTCATLRRDGSVWCVGSNYASELGAGVETPVESHVFVEALVFHAGTRAAQTTTGECVPCSVCPVTHTQEAACTVTAEHGVDTDCVSCPATEFANAARTACFGCPVGFDCTGGEVVPCPAGTHSTSGVCSAACAPGSFCPGDGTQQGCGACAPGEYVFSVCNRSQDVVCAACPADFYCAEMDTLQPTACPAHAVSPAGSFAIESCTCVGGYRQCNSTHHLCIACEAGTYCFDEMQYECPHPNQTSAALSDDYDDCFCVAGTFSYGGDQHDCRVCPADSWCPFNVSQPVQCIGNASTLPSQSTGNQRELDCQCDRGHYSSAVPADNCVACEADYWCPGHNVTHACSNTTSTWGRRGSGVEEDCTPIAGYYRGNLTGDPIICPAGFYCAGDAAPPVRCPQHSTSVPGSVRVQDCICEATFFGECVDDCDGFCEPCSAGSFCMGDEHVAVCPPLTTSGLGAAGSATDCTCINGYAGPGGGPCTMCAVDSWCPGGPASSNCPLNSHTFGITGRDEATDCACLPGSYGPAGFACVECEAGAYCEGAPAPRTAGIKQACPEFSTTSGTGSADILACVCNFGYYALGDDSCAECTADSYCQFETRTACPVNASSAARSDEPTDCSCNAGYEGVNGGTCNECQPNFYCPGGNVRETCYTYSYSLPGSSAVSECLCNAGYYYVADDGGGARCEVCPAGSWCPGDGPRHPCPDDSTSAVGSVAQAQCRCFSGFYAMSGWGGACLPCPANRYCPGFESGNRTEPCPANTESLVGSASVDDCFCIAGHKDDENDLDGPCIVCSLSEICLGGGGSVRCPTNSLPLPNATNTTDCVCNPGFVGEHGGFCSTCSSNAWCPGGNEENLCPPSTVTLAVGQDEATDCFCGPGYVGPAGGPCAACEAGSWCAGNAVNLSEMCPPSTTSNPRSSQRSACQCAPGYYGSTPDSCLSCPINRFCRGHDDNNPCDPNAHAPMMSSAPEACVCNAGFYGPAGSECLPCPFHEWCPGDNVRAACTPNSVTLSRQSDDATDCECLPGFYHLLSSSNASGPANTAAFTCESCPAGSWCAGHSLDAPVACPNNTDTQGLVERFNVTQCKCSPQWYGPTPLSCQECEPGFTCPGGNVLTACPLNSFASSGSSRVEDCVCNPGYYGTTADVCQQAGVGFYSTGANDLQPCPPNSNTTGMGASSLAQCVCNPGFEGNEAQGQQCAACEQGVFCVGGQRFTCPQFSSTRSPQSDEQLDCVPDAGYHGPLGGEHTQPCDDDHYCIGDGSMAACPNGTVTTIARAFSLGQCLCAPGTHGTSTTQCDECSVGAYCPGGSNQFQCSSDPVQALGITSAAGSDELTDCVCIPGYYGSDGGPCVECDADRWCPGGTVENACPEGASAPVRSDAQDDCKCDAGFYAHVQPPALQCRECPANSCCPWDGDVTMQYARSACPLNAVSFPRSTSKGACYCPDGYREVEGNADGDCELCPPGEICLAGNGTLRCPSHSF